MPSTRLPGSVLLTSCLLTSSLGEVLGPSNLEHCLWILRTVIDFPQSLAAGAVVVCCIRIHWLPVTLHGHHCPHCLFSSLPSLPSLREDRKGLWADKAGKGYSSSTFPSKQDASFPRRELGTAVQLSVLSPSAATTSMATDISESSTFGQDQEEHCGPA